MLLHAAQDVLAALDAATLRREEGVVFKDLDAPYLCGEQGRRSQRWVKVKGDHIAGISETMDCLILAAYYGEGSVRGRRQWLTRPPPH